jgi:hypothetical protein
VAMPAAFPATAALATANNANPASTAANAKRVDAALSAGEGERVDDALLELLAAHQPAQSSRTSSERSVASVS